MVVQRSLRALQPRAGWNTSQNDGHSHSLATALPKLSRRWPWWWWWWWWALTAQSEMTTGQGNWLTISPDWSLLASLCPWSARQEPILLNSSVLFPFTFSYAHISKQHRVGFCRILLLWSSSLGSNGRLWSPTTGVIWICILPFGHLPPNNITWIFIYLRTDCWVEICP